MIKKLKRGKEKNSCIFLLLALIISGCGHNSEEEKTYYDNGALKCKGTLVDGKREGLLLCYYPDGKVKLASNWKDGKRDGKRVTYYRNGNENEVSFYKKGVPDGQIQFYDSTGTLRQIGEMVDGKQQGMDYVYDENSLLVAETRFRNNMRHGKAFNYDEKGNVTGRYIYKNDTIVYSIEYFDNNKVANRILTYENTAESTNENEVGQPQNFVLKLMHSFYDDAYVGLLIGDINESGLLTDTLYSFTSDSLALHYQLVPKRTGTNKITGYVYEILDGKIENQMRIEYEFEVK